MPSMIRCNKVEIYYIIRCSRMWRHSHCPSPPSFFLFRHFDSKNCNLTNVNTNIKTSANLPYLFITACFGSYRSREGVMGAFPHPTFSCARPLFPFVLSLKSFVLPLLSYDSWRQKMGVLRNPFEGLLDFLKIPTWSLFAWDGLGPIWRGIQFRGFHGGWRGSGANFQISHPSECFSQ